MNDRNRELNIFFWFSLFLLVFAITAFTLRAWLDAENLPSMGNSLVVHAIACGLWLAYVPTQAYLIAKRRITIHQTLGWASVVLAIAVVSSGVIISFEFLERMEANAIFRDRAFFFFFAGIVNFALFFSFYTLAIVRRRDREFHKRMMMFASVVLIPPAFNRLVFAFDLPPSVTNIGWLFLVFVIPIYDRWKEGRLTSGSKIGLGLVALGIFTVIVGTGLNNSMRGA